MRKLEKYKRLARELRKEKPITALGGKEIPCYRQADQRELEVTDALLEMYYMSDRKNQN